MGFKQELLKKIQIDRLTEKILATIGPSGTEQKVDKGLFRVLLEMAEYRHLRERDLDLYLPPEGSKNTHILVLDNDLPFYKTTVSDIAMRKSPTVKEMVNIRNAIKILNDSDVVVSKKADSVKTVRHECFSRLNLSFSAGDIEAIALDGAGSLEHGYAEGVQECLDLFAELLGYQPAPKAFKMDHHRIIGPVSQKDTGEIVFGPIVCFNLMHNRLFAVLPSIGSFDLIKMDWYQEVMNGAEKPSLTGAEVFQFLKDEVGRGGYSPS
ncbi:MAG: hypothetical protein HY881_02885 [Deltaproteobacteria bacterium]|nr:hypothetical protein [Deltaproteobacteria bacterium]